MASRYAQGGPGTTSAGAFFQNQRAPQQYKPLAGMGMNGGMNMNGGGMNGMGGMPQPQMQPVNGQPRAVRQGSNGGTPRGPTPGSDGHGQQSRSGSGKRMDRKDTKDTAWVHWRALKDFLAAWADKGESNLARSMCQLRWLRRAWRSVDVMETGARTPAGVGRRPVRSDSGPGL